MARKLEVTGGSPARSIPDCPILTPVRMSGMPGGRVEPLSGCPPCAANRRNTACRLWSRNSSIKGGRRGRSEWGLS
jgi:hypothetical protein